MKLSDLFQKISADVLDVHQPEGLLVITTRFSPKDELAVDRWRTVIQHVLVRSAANTDWAADVSRVYVPKGGQVVYYWRWMFSGDTKAALKTLADVVLNLGKQVLDANGGNLESWPLRGRIDYVPDPTTGQIKGAYSMQRGAAVISTMITAKAGAQGVS